MDEIFLDEEARGTVVGALAQVLGCTYICLWSYYPFPYNQLFCIHSWFNGNTSDLPSSSSHQPNHVLLQTLFDTYRQMLHPIENGCVPGHAFKEGVPYLELNDLELLNRASSDIQRNFYQEARIQKAVFMGCKSGEIEIGISNLNPQINIEMELKNWFQTEDNQRWNVTSSYSSLLQPLSVGSSPEYSSFHMLNVPIQSFPYEFPKESPTITNSILLDPLVPYNAIQFPNAENDDAAMTRAMLAVISSAHCSSPCPSIMNRDYSAFSKYVPGLSRNIRMKRNSQGQDMIKRAIVFYTKMYMRRRFEEQTAQLGARSTTSSLHHKMSERRRREKLNESFESLRSLLPSSSKKDKASLLSNTREYLGTLKTEVSELKQKCRVLEAQLTVPTARSILRSSLLETGGSSSNRNVEILISQASEPTALAPAEEQQIDLQVTVRGDYCTNMMDLVLRILEFLKQVEHISLVNMEAETQPQSLNSFHRAIFRLRIQGGQFDSSTFQEAIQRIIDDLGR